LILYQTLVQSVILYNSETNWTLKEEQKQKLRVFEMSVLRKMWNIKERSQTKSGYTEGIKRGEGYC